MNYSPKRPNFFFYAVLLTLLIVALVSMFGTKDLPEISYSQVRTLFTEETVTSFLWEEGVLTLELSEPFQDSTTVCHFLADVEMFREDMSPIYERQLSEGILESYDFVPLTDSSWLWDLLLYGGLMLVAVFLLYFLLLRSSNSNNPGAKFGKANAQLGTGKKKVTFDDVAGADEEKAELEEIVDFLRDPDKYRAMGAKIPRGVLLVGPPGTGKTLIAKAVAGEADVQFLSISGSDFMELYVGVGASRVRDLFDQAKKIAPAIIFIDEIDAVGRKRGAGLGGGHDEREQTLNQLLVEMDGFGSNDGVIVMAATNRHDILDPALLRPGRFDRQIYVSRPDSKGREAILKVHARNKPLSDNVDLNSIARSTVGFTGADLANLLNEAALLAAKEDAPAITMEMIEGSILKVIAGPEKRSRVQTERDRRITAYHEAGHAIASYHLPTQDPVHQITIVPRGSALGMTINLPEEDSTHWTRNEMREQIITLLGGRVAEALIFDDITTGASNDLQRATNIAHDMVAKYGMSEQIGAVSFDNGDEIFIGRDYERTKSYSEQTGSEIDGELRRVIDSAYARCKELLTANRDKLDQIASFLLEHEIMTRSEFESCMKGSEAPHAASDAME